MSNILWPKIDFARINPNGLMPTLSLNKKDGSGSATVCEVKTVAKFGPVADLQAEGSVYQEMKHFLGDSFSVIFPAFYLVPLKGQSEAILLLEPIPGKSLESEILAIGSAISKQDNNLIIAGQSTVNEMVAKVIDLLDVLHRPLSFTVSSSSFFSELLDAIDENLQIAKLSAYLPAVTGKTRIECLNNKYIPACLTHRDLSVVNVIGDDKQVRLIDPRLVVPQGKPEIIETVYASPLIDWVTLDVSLERKELEINHQAIEPVGLKAREMVRVKIESFLTDSRNQLIGKLCRVAVYSAYAACKCSYCLDPQRRWLYDIMVQKTIKSINDL